MALRFASALLNAVVAVSYVVLVAAGARSANATTRGQKTQQGHAVCVRACVRARVCVRVRVRVCVCARNLCGTGRGGSLTLDVVLGGLQ